MKTFNKLKLLKMTLQKPLLKAIALGLAVGATAPACSFLENSDDVRPLTEEKAQQVDNEECEADQKGHTYDCPACGMG
jgi:hypothetical protein